MTNQIAGYINNSTFIYEVVTYPFKWKVRRHDSNFEALRDYLIRAYPQTIIPPLPKVNKSRKLTHKQMKRKINYYQRFLQCVMKSQILRGCEFLVEFLREPNIEAIQLRIMGTKQDIGPKSIYDFKTLIGEIEVNATKNAQDFCN